MIMTTIRVKMSAFPHQSRKDPEGSDSRIVGRGACASASACLNQWVRGSIVFSKGVASFQVARPALPIRVDLGINTWERGCTIVLEVVGAGAIANRHKASLQNSCKVRCSRLF